MAYKARSFSKSNYSGNKGYKAKSFSKQYGEKNTGGLGEGLGYIAGNIGIGAAGIVEGVTDLVSAAGLAITGQGDKAKQVFMDSWSGEWKEALDDWYNPNAAMSFIGDVGGGLGNSLVAMVPFVGLPSFFAGAAGGGISSAAQQTGDVGFKEVGYGVTSGIVEGLLEKYVGPGAAKVKGLGTKALSSLTKNTAKSAVRNSAIKGIISNASEEFLEEALAEMATPLIERFWKINPNATTSFGEVLRAGIVGGISGGILGGTQIGISSALDLNRGRSIAKAGNTENVLRIARDISGDQFFKSGEFSNVNIKDLQGTLNAYEALSEEKRESDKGKRLLGELNRQIFAVEMTARTQGARKSLYDDAETTAEWASGYFRKNYTAEDIKKDKDGILTYSSVIKWLRGTEKDRERVKAAKAQYSGATPNAANGTEGVKTAQEAQNGVNTGTNSQNTTNAPQSANMTVEEETATNSTTESNNRAALLKGEIANLNSQLEAAIKEDGEESIYAENIRLAIQEREKRLEKLVKATTEANDVNSKRKYDLQSALDTLGEYDTVRHRHIESSENDKISRNYQEIKEFIKNSTKHNPVKRLHIGRVNDTVAAMVKAKTGKDIKDYDFVIASNFIAHIFDQHGNPIKETPRGQIAVDFQNIENIIETVISPDDVKITKDNNNAEALQFEKDIEGHNIAITITSTKKSTLTLKSAWIINKNSGGRTPSANANAFAGTSKTNGRSSTNNSIHQNEPNVKTSAKNKNDLSKSDASTLAKNSKSQTSAETETKESENSDNEYEYSAEIQKKARKACKVFDMLSYERKAAICELIKSNDGTLDSTNISAISAILASREGLFAFVGSLNDNNVVWNDGIAEQVWKNGSHEVVNGAENTRVITIAKDSEVINDSKDKQGALAQTFIHEVIHDMKARLNSAYKELVKTASKYISKERLREITDIYTKDMVGTSFSEWLKNNEGKKWSDYLAAFPAVDSEAITEEVTAKFIGEALGGTKYIKYLADQKVSTLRSVARMTKTVAKMIFGKNATTDRMMFDVYASFKSALDSAELGKVSESEVKYNLGKENSSIKEQMRAHLDELNKLDPVVDIKYTKLENKKALESRAIEEFKKIGMKVERKDFGVIELGENEIRKSLNYINNDAEFAAFLTVHKVLKKGIIIDGHQDHKGRSYETVTIAATVKINDTEGIVGVVVTRLGKNRYKTHRILLPNGAEFVFKTKKDTEPTLVDMTASKSGEGSTINSVSGNSIYQNSENVNTSGKKSVKYDLSEPKNEKKYGTWSGENYDKLSETERIERHKTSISNTIGVLKDMISGKEREHYDEIDTFIKNIIDGALGADGYIGSVSGNRRHIRVKLTRQKFKELYQGIKGIKYGKDDDVLQNTEDKNYKAKNIVEQYIPEEILSALDDIALRDGDTLTADDYEIFDSVLNNLVAVYKSYDKVYIEGGYKKISDITSQYVQEQLELVENEPKRNFIGKLGVTFKRLASTFLDTRGVMAMFDGYKKNGVLTRLFGNIEMASYNAMILKSEILKERDEFFEAHKGFEKRLREEKVEFYGHSITLGEAISLIMTSKREQAWLALYGSDIHFLSGRENKIKGRGFEDISSEPDIKAAIDAMLAPVLKIAENDSDVREYIEIAERIFNDKSSIIKAEADMNYFGYTNVSHSYYFPISRSKDAFAPDLLGASGNFEDFTSIRSLSFNKNIVKNAKAALVITNVNDVINRHVDGLTKYSEMYGAITAMNRVLGKKFTVKRNTVNGVKELIIGEGTTSSPQSIMSILSENIFDGDSAALKRYFVRYLNDAQGFNSGDNTRFDKLVALMRKNYTVFALGLNMKSVMSQLAAIPLVLYQVTPTSLIQGVMGRYNLDKMDEYSKAAKARNIDNVVAKTSGLVDSVGKIGDLTMKPISWTDRASFYITWSALQVEVEKKHGYAIGSEENLTEAGKMLDDFASQTQPTPNKEAASAASRSNSQIVKALMMFTSANVKMFSRIFESVGRYAHLSACKKAGAKVSEKELAEARTEAVRHGASVLASTAFLVALIQLWKWLFARDREEGETVTEDVIGEAASSLVGLVPVVNKIYSHFADGYEIGDITYDTINLLLENTKTTMKLGMRAMGGDYVSNREVNQLLRDHVYGLGQIFGLPTRNLYNDIYGIVKHASPSTGYRMNSVFYSPQYSDIQKALNSGNDALVATVSEILFRESYGGELATEHSRRIIELNEMDYTVLPRKLSDEVTVDEVKVELNAKQYNAFRRIYTKGSQLVSEMMDTPEFAELSDEAQAKAIRTAYDLYWNSAKSSVLGAEVKKSQIYSDFNDMSVMIPIASHIAGLESDDEDVKNGKTRKEKVEKYIKPLGLTKSQTAWIMYASGYTSYGEDILKEIEKSSYSDEEKAVAIDVLNLEKIAKKKNKSPLFTKN